MHTYTCSAPWRDALAPGDLVAFVFPSSECEAALEKRRPCLVLEVHRSGGVAEAVVAYGTGAAASRRTARDELPVSLAEDLHHANLRKPTRFLVRRTVRVPLSDARFVESAAGDAVIGRLPPALLDRLDRIRNGPPVRRVRFLRRPHRRPFDGRAAGASLQPGKESA